MKKMTKLTTSDFSIGDAVRHIRGSPTGIVISHDHARGLLRVRWESQMAEWVPPEELKPLASR